MSGPDYWSFLYRIEKRKTYQYKFHNQFRFPTGMDILLRYLRQFYDENMVWLREEGDVRLLETVVDFTEGELGYFQGVHDFGLAHIVAPVGHPSLFNLDQEGDS